MQETSLPNSLWDNEVKEDNVPRYYSQADTEAVNNKDDNQIRRVLRLGNYHYVDPRVHRLGAHLLLSLIHI